MVEDKGREITLNVVMTACGVGLWDHRYSSFFYNSMVYCHLLKVENKQVRCIVIDFYLYGSRVAVMIRCCQIHHTDSN